MYGNDGISVADALALRNSGNNYGDGMWAVTALGGLLF